MQGLKLSKHGWCACAEQQVHTVSYALNGIAMFTILAIAVLSFADVVGRELGRPILGKIDITQVMMIFAVYMGLAYCNVIKGHTYVEVVVSRLPRRTQAIMASITSLGSALIFSLISWRLFVRAWADLQSPCGPHTYLIVIPLTPFYFVAVVGSLLLSLELLIDFFHAVARAREQREIGYGGETK